MTTRRRPPASTPIPSSIDTVGSDRRACWASPSNSDANSLRDRGTDDANRKSPPASMAGRGTRFSSGGGGNGVPGVDFSPSILVCCSLIVARSGLGVGSYGNRLPRRWS